MKLALDEIASACGGASPLWRIFIGRIDSFISDFSKRIEAGVETGSRIGDPCFVDPEHYDYRLRADSPAIALGFRPFDLCRAGRIESRNGRE